MTLEEFDDEYLFKSNHKFIMLRTGQQLLNIDMKVVKYPLYRSMEKKWFDHMMKTGEIRVGTLWDFRDKVKYGDKIGDEDAVYFAHLRERRKFLMSCGAMDPLDRLESQIYREGMRAKYGLGPTPQKPRSQRCQDYLANKITIDEAVERGPGADEPKPQRTGVSQP